MRSRHLLVDAFCNPLEAALWSTSRVGVFLRRREESGEMIIRPHELCNAITHTQKTNDAGGVKCIDGATGRLRRIIYPWHAQLALEDQNR
jgi:hypothetical protein